MKKELTYTLTGCDAAAAKLVDEVQKIFHSKSWKLAPKDDWRLEYYIMQAINVLSSWEIEKDKIIKIVIAAHEYDRPQSEVNTAFRRLVRGKFLYSKTRNKVQFEPSRGKARYYGMSLGRYDTDEVEA